MAGRSPLGAQAVGGDHASKRTGGDAMKVLSGQSMPVVAGGQTAEPSPLPEAGAAIQVGHLRKTYRTGGAVDDVSFSVREGEIFGILGPNGAGKPTTVECVIGRRPPDAGTIRVMGLDPQVDREGLHAMVGVQLQASVLPGHLK